MPKPKTNRGKFRMTSDFLHQQLVQTSIERGEPVRAGYMDRTSLQELLVENGVPAEDRERITQVDFQGVKLLVLRGEMAQRVHAFFRSNPNDDLPIWGFFTGEPPSVISVDLEFDETLPTDKPPIKATPTKKHKPF